MSNILVTSLCWEEKESGSKLCDCQGVLHVTHGGALYVEDAKFLQEDWKSTCGDTEDLMPNASEPDFFLLHRLPKWLCTFLLPGEVETWSSFSFVV